MAWANTAGVAADHHLLTVMDYSGLFSPSMPPTIEEVRQHFTERGLTVLEAEIFFLFHEKRKWKSKAGRFYRTWKAPASRWIKDAMDEQ